MYPPNGNGGGYGYGPPPPTGGYGPPQQQQYGYGPPPGYGPGYGMPPPGYAVVPIGYGPMLLPKCSRASYVLLGIFLGGLGIHNFVAGRVGSGIAQLLLTLLLGWTLFAIPVIWLWVIIELIVVDRDGNGVRMS